MERCVGKNEDNIRSCENFGNGFVAIGQDKKSFNNYQCWEVMKNCPRFKIIVTGPTIVLNVTPLHDSSALNSPLESPMNEDSPIQRKLMPIGRKAAKAKIRSNSIIDCAKFLEKIALNGTMRINRDMKKDEDEKNLTKLSKIMDFLILAIASTWSADAPNGSIHKEVVSFCSGRSPKTPVASYFVQKYTL
ncbi:unnamed protein product [Prunus armeniaca]